jgi:hypothetical protein
MRYICQLIRSWGWGSSHTGQTNTDTPQDSRQTGKSAFCLWKWQWCGGKLSLSSFHGHARVTVRPLYAGIQSRGCLLSTLMLPALGATEQRVRGGGHQRQ